MKKIPLTERFQQLAGIKPLYEQLGPRKKNPRPTGPSDDRSSKDIEFDNAQAMDRLTPDDKDKMGKIQQMMDKEKVLAAIETVKKVKAGPERRKAMGVILDAAKAKTGESPRTLKQALEFLDLEDIDGKDYKKAEFVYSEGNGRFYSLNLYTSDGQKTKLGLTQYDEANEWVKEQLEYIHEDDLIPKHYGSGLEDLDLIVDRLKELGIEASHNEYDFS